MTNHLVSLGFILLGSITQPAVVDAQAATNLMPSTTSTETGTTTSSNGSSTGVGNAGSFGIASGTSNSTSVATATSNGFQQANTYNLSNSGTSIKTVSTQDLQATTTNNQITINAGANPTNSPLPTGANTISGSTFSNYSGILAIGWNTGPAGSAVAANNIAANGSLAQK